MVYRAVLTGLLVALFCLPAALAEKNSGEAVELFNGEDFSGWKLFIPDENVDPKTVWSVEDGVVHCTGEPHGYMRTKEKYSDYELTFDWRWLDEGGNSGLLIHAQEPDKVWPKCIEGQLMHENAADFWLIDGTEVAEHKDPESRRVPKMKESNEKPLGEWNSYRAVVDGDTIELYVNGELQNRGTEASLTEGYIALQSEGTPIEFRNIVLTPLD